MKRLLCLFISTLLLAGCSAKFIDNTNITNSDNSTNNTNSNNNSSTNTVEPPKHSNYYIEELTADEIVYYFNDVCFGNEYGDEKNIITKWYDPILFYIEGYPTSEDFEVLNGLINFLNNIDGFPGITRTSNKSTANLVVNFCDLYTFNTYSPELNADGFATFNYITATGVITDGSVYIRSDIDQTLRNSVILEELYQILGPTTDTVIREDSIINQYGDALELSKIDKIIIAMLYNKNITYGMDTVKTEEVIREIYY